MIRFYSKKWHIIKKRKGYPEGCMICRKQIIEGKEVWAKMGYGTSYICLECWDKIEREEEKMNEMKRHKKELIEEEPAYSLEERLFDEENEYFGYGE